LRALSFALVIEDEVEAEAEVVEQVEEIEVEDPERMVENG